MFLTCKGSRQSHGTNDQIIIRAAVRLNDTHKSEQMCTLRVSIQTDTWESFTWS